MPSFTQRSKEKELLDRDDVPLEDIKRNMMELDLINHRLGGHRITIAGLKSLLPYTGEKHMVSIVEIGSGGGDNLRVIRDWAKEKGIQVKLTGIDINPHCIAYAGGLEQNETIHFICSDYKEVSFEQQPDLIFSSLFCHHFSNEELCNMLRWMKANSRVGFFINDLHRHPVAYYSIKWLTRIFSRSYLVKNDAPVSVLRGFEKKDWDLLFHEAGIGNFNCEWKWAFRWLITYRH